MTYRKLLLGVIALALASGWAVLVPAGLTAEEDEEVFTYVGVKKCKMCHNKEATGQQYAIWAESAHAQAYEVLASEKALAHAKEVGMGNPQEAPECLKCHVTAFSVMDDLENQKITLEEGISCESCHGPGSGYDSKKVKEAVAAGEVTPESVGLLVVTEETCTQCHTEEGNPFYKEFDFEERVEMIAHPIPGGDDDEDAEEDDN